MAVGPPFAMENSKTELGCREVKVVVSRKKHKKHIRRRRSRRRYREPEAKKFDSGKFALELLLIT
jgi:RNase P protein component